MRYFFHYRDASRYFADAEGGEFADLAAAENEGRESARELLGSGRREPNAGYLAGVFEIADALGKVLAVVTFDETVSEASPPLRRAAATVR